MFATWTFKLLVLVFWELKRNQFFDFDGMWRRRRTDELLLGRLFDDCFGRRLLFRRPKRCDFLEFGNGWDKKWNEYQIWCVRFILVFVLVLVSSCCLLVFGSCLGLSSVLPLLSFWFGFLFPWHRVHTLPIFVWILSFFSVRIQIYILCNKSGLGDNREVQKRLVGTRDNLQTASMILCPVAVSAYQSLSPWLSTIRRVNRLVSLCEL